VNPAFGTNIPAMESCRIFGGKMKDAEEFVEKYKAHAQKTNK